MENYILDLEIDSEITNALFLTPTAYTPPHQGASTNVEALPPPPLEPSTSVEDLLQYLEKEMRKGKKKPYINKILKLKLKKLLKEIKDTYKRNKLFEVKRTNSPLKNFARVFTI